MSGVIRVMAAALATAALVVGQAAPAAAYLKFGYEVNGRPQTLRWSQGTVAYYISDNTIPSVTPTALLTAVGRAFSTWDGVASADIGYRFAGFTESRPGMDDGLSTIGFLSEPALDRVLASTSYLIDGLTGELLESDIFFNSAFPWSARTEGEAARWDVQSIAVHEIGHLNGLGHSAIGETQLVGGGRRVLSTGAVMFPIALGLGDTSARTLKADDIAGLTDLYPSESSSDATGSLSGRVIKNGSGVFGAHVVAFNPGTGDQVGNFTLNTNGRFSIAGLTPGPYLLRVEPLDDVDLESFFGNGEPVDLNFKVSYFSRLVVVPRGGDSGSVDIPVVPK